MALRKETLYLLENTVGVSDAVLLQPINEKNFLENLKRRFQANQIYTYIGSVVISVNPYKKLPLYNEDVISEYRSRNMYELPPHIYAVVDEAYRSMRDKDLDQCVIISGESGAGKTEASKVIMQYVVAVSGKGQDIDHVKEQLLQSNPVLEAFGNAKTNRNDNSSRFGKYMDIEFDFKGNPLGGVITNYLLEKSRVSGQPNNERSFHVFYQVLSGADDQLLKSLKLKRRCEEYAYIAETGARIESIDDTTDFETTKLAMSVIGFSDDEISAVLQLVASVLKLGNIQLESISGKNGMDASTLSQTTFHELTEICELLQCDSEIMEAALTKRTVETISDKVVQTLSLSAAIYGRDALAKAIYSKMFSWLVNRINDKIKVISSKKRKVLGVLDIYGFEVFRNNSFEQFIINYCNEKLQQIFIELTLKEEQEEYTKEGIEWIHVDYFNNAIICDLIENTKNGILAMLDEECLRPGIVSDDTFLQKLTRTCCDHPHFESRGCKKTRSDKTLLHDTFRLRHYAGAVTYNTDGFLEKNNDLLYRDLSQAMFSCQHSLCQKLFPEGDPDQLSLKRPPTTTSQFKVSVNQLMKNLLSKNPNYIRCIKPNDFKKSGQLDDHLLVHQVRYLGLLENVRVRRAGYAFRQQYERFLCRYKMLSPNTWPSWDNIARDGVREILLALEYNEKEFAFGKTKIFISNPLMLFNLEERRRHKMHDLATEIQKVYRGWHQKNVFQAMKQSQILISAQYRGYQARTDYQRLRHATLVVEAFHRGWQARKLLRKLKRERRVLLATQVIHKYFIGWQIRKEFRKKFRSNAVPKIIEFMKVACKKHFLRRVSENLPSLSPIDNSWPECYLKNHQPASEELRQLYHGWRCAKYRNRFDDTGKIKMREKVAASEIFKGKKKSYENSVAIPFCGDYIGLVNNRKWYKMTTGSAEAYVVFADVVNKINRSNGKMIPHILVITANSLLLLDQKSSHVKYRIPLQSVSQIICSPHSDGVLVFRLRHGENGNSSTKKGDFVFHSQHIFEIVAKCSIGVKSNTGKSLKISLSDRFMTDFGGMQVEVIFKMGVAEIEEGNIRLSRNRNSLTILQP